MSNFATPGGYHSDDEGGGEFRRLRASVNRDPLVSYGAAGLLPPPPKHRRKRRGRRLMSSESFMQQVMSAAGYEKMLEARKELEREEESDSESEEEEGPPIVEMIYRRNCKDKIKLIVLPLLYFIVMILAGIFAFYSIEGLITSYRHRVRTVNYVTVPDGTYDPVGIAMFLQDFATFVNCSFLYSDDLFPGGESNWTPLLPPAESPFCTSINVTFYSQLIKANRTAMVFRGPTLASLKQSLGIHFRIDTTKRQFSAIEYLLFSDWHAVFNRSEADQNDSLSNEEKNKPLHTVPGGFRTWIKMSKVVFNVAGADNVSDISITADFSKYGDNSDRTTDVVYVLFEWESTTHEFIGEILSTNIWNTLGGLAGVLVTLFYVGDLCKRWIWRMRRERKKTILKLQELSEEQQRLLEEYEQKMEEKNKCKQIK